MNNPFWWFVAAINTFLLLSSFYFIVRFKRDEIKKPSDQKSPILLHYLGLSFFIISSILLLLYVAFSIALVYETANLLRIISTIIFICYYGLQLYLLWLVMFIKLYYVFKESVYQLSLCTLRFFIILFIILPTALGINLFLFTMANPETEIYHRYLFIMYGIIALFSLILTYLFVYKLYKIYRDSNQQSKMDPNDTFLSIMSKTTILTFTSIFFTMLVPLILVIFETFKAEPDHTHDFKYGILTVIGIFDVYTNFLCVMLSYSILDNVYKKWCGCCDDYFKKCLFKVGTKADQEKSNVV